MISFIFQERKDMRVMGSCEVCNIYLSVLYVNVPLLAGEWRAVPSSLHNSHYAVVTGSGALKVLALTRQDNGLQR